MMGAKSLTRADGGSLYFLKDGLLTFEIISNDSLNLQMGGTSGNDITFLPIPLIYDGEENHSNIVSQMHITKMVSTLTAPGNSIVKPVIEPNLY